MRKAATKRKRGVRREGGREGGRSTAALTSRRTQSPPSCPKKMPSAARALYCINCSLPPPPRTPPPRPLSHAAHIVGQPMSWKRGLKAPAAPPTIGLLEARRGKSSLPFLLANPTPLPLPSFAVGRHYGGHYSRPSKLPRELSDSDAGVSRGARSHKPRGTPSSPAEPQMWRIYQMRGPGLSRYQVSRFCISARHAIRTSTYKTTRGCYEVAPGFGTKTTATSDAFYPKNGGSCETAQSCWIAEISDLKCHLSILKSYFLKHFSNGFLVLSIDF